MNKWQLKQNELRISESVVRSKTKEELLRAKSFLECLLDMKKVTKLRSTYVNGVRKAIKYNNKNKIYVDNDIAGTVTGRLSCRMYKAKEPMGVSFHTLPRESDDSRYFSQRLNNVNVRKFITAPPGYKFITADYSTMEMRIMAYISGDRAMIEAFIRDEDLHTFTAQLLFQKEKPTKYERQVAKSVSFLIIYGGGPFTLAKTTGVSIPEAESILNRYKDLYPGVFSYMEDTEKFIKEHKYAVSIFGRRRNLLDVDSPELKLVLASIRQGVNFTVQSPASDILLCAFININRRLIKESLDARVVASVHDSIEAIAREEHLKRAVDIIYDEMVNYPYLKKNFGFNFSVPFKVDIEVGTSFGTGEKVLMA